MPMFRRPDRYSLLTENQRDVLSRWEKNQRMIWWFLLFIVSAYLTNWGYGMAGHDQTNNSIAGELGMMITMIIGPIGLVYSIIGMVKFVREAGRRGRE